jgi:hypothetical protein
MRVVGLSMGDVEAWRGGSAPLLEAYIEHAGPAGPELSSAYGRLHTSPCCREAPETWRPDEAVSDPLRLQQAGRHAGPSPGSRASRPRGMP